MTRRGFLLGGTAAIAASAIALPAASSGITLEGVPIYFDEPGMANAFWVIIPEPVTPEIRALLDSRIRDAMIKTQAYADQIVEELFSRGSGNDCPLASLLA